MHLSGVLAELARDPSIEAALSASASSAPVTIELRDALKSLFVPLLSQRLGRPVIVVTTDDARARELAQDMRAWSPKQPVLHFPDPDQPAYSMLAISHDVLAQRVAVLAQLVRAAENSSEPGPIVVSSLRAAMRRLMPVEEFRAHFLALTAGASMDLETTVRRLVALGYAPTPLVERPGEFARRGGIVDIFAPDGPLPVRVDFFGDEIESLRAFDPETQREVGAVSELVLAPATEVPIWLGDRVAGRLRRLDLAGLRPEERQIWARHLEQLEGEEYFDDAAFYTMSLVEDAAMLFEFCQDAVLVVDEPDQMAWTAREAEKTAAENRARLTASGELPAEFTSPLFSADELLPMLEAAPLRLTYVPGLPGASDGRRCVIEGFQPLTAYAGRLRRMCDDLEEMRADGQRVVLVSYQGRRLQQLMADQGLVSSAADSLDEPPPEGSITVVGGTLAEGWRYAPGRLVVVSDAEIFGRTRVRPLRRRARAADRTFLSDLSKGDHVVHVEHGIARFEGIVRLGESMGDREYLLLQYTGDDRLYVPVDQIGRVQKFVGMSDQAPKLSRLGTPEWQRAKKKAQKSAGEIAAELLDIYAAREVARGHAFAADSAWQREFEDAFPFIETPDQLQAIRDVKADMERRRPMDRLIAGDVGYGKTEVALRAAFKAAMDGKQVAVLVPTTILAQQHFDTFHSRAEKFPLRVELLSRFRSRAEQSAVVAGLASGEVDIVIGTHRLLQADVVFADLGLVVVDEEQRFGVSHKERLKALRKDVDVVTLTATPIPRTMHMALSGLREISVIESPPEQRLAVKTYVTTYSDEIVRDAILREIERGGQVYFLHNRVHSIHTWEERLRELVPEVEILVAHGQMPAGELEEVMYRFARGDAQVLLASAIIENGLDIPNVNTIVVNDAWRFGLAQLYQLRGRVGRAATQAYAYFVHHKDHMLTEESQKRLQTILEASDLGAGFRIAMRDLEIRGAGNLLGAEQHGHVSAVGFDLYTRMLGDAVERLRGNEPDPVEGMPVVVDLPLDAYLPDPYMGSYATKVREYQRLAKLRGLDEVEEAIADIRDRFGELPPPVENLAYLMRVKARAHALGFATVTTYGRELIIKMPRGYQASLSVMRATVGSKIRQGQSGLVWDGFEHDPKWSEKLLALLDGLMRWTAPAAVAQPADVS